MSDSHGNTPAAWSAVVVALVGFVVGAVGVILNPINWIIFWVGVVITAVAGVLFIVMSKLGYNVESH